MTSKWAWRLRQLAIFVIATILAWAGSQGYNVAREYTRLATENEQMRFADEGALRSRTNFQRPGITAEQVKWIGIISADYGIPEGILYSFFRTERGRRGLYMGANFISPEIRLRYPPLWWQFAMAAKTWNRHLNEMVAFDPYLRQRTLWSYAKQWNPDPTEYVATVIANLDLVRVNGLEVTEPPKARPSVDTSKQAEAKASKAIGAADKRPKHTSKEKRR